MKKRFRRLKRYLIPHAGNRYKPALFAKESVAVMVLLLFVVESVYVFATPFVLERTGFTAAVLPAALTEMTNSDRTASGHAALTPDPLLSQAAQKKADDMAAKGYFAHVSPDGKTPWYWLDAVGYKYTYAGENLAINFTDSVDVEAAWMNSPEHHANIVKPEYTRIGIGTAQGLYEGKETTFVVELFAAIPEQKPVATAPSKPASQQTPVAAAPAPQNSQVLGAQVEQTTPAPVTTAPSSGAGTLATALTSPNRTLTILFGIFVALIAALLGIAVFMKIKIQYVEVLGGGLVVIFIGLFFMFFNMGATSAVQLPHDAQAASVSLAL